MMPLMNQRRTCGREDKEWHRSLWRVHHSGPPANVEIVLHPLDPVHLASKSAALAFCSAFSTVPTNVTTPDSVVTLMPDNPPN